jgi:hypothetical protein
MGDNFNRMTGSLNIAPSFFWWWFKSQC